MQWRLLCGCKPGDLTSKTASDRLNFIPTLWRRLPLGGYRALLSPFSRLDSCRRVAGLTFPSPCAVNRLVIRKVLGLDNNPEVWFVRLAWFHAVLAAFWQNVWLPSSRAFQLPNTPAHELDAPRLSYPRLAISTPSLGKGVL